MASLRTTKETLLKTDVSPVHEDCENDSRESSIKPKPKAVRDGQYSDPVYKKLSLINGEINKLTKEQLREKCAEMRLDTRGMKDVLKKRLKNYYKRKKLMKARVHPPEGCKTPYDYLLVIDFEATCEANVDDYCHEIIEFPGILVDVQQNKIVDEFHSYCRPVLNPDLTKFCSDLTGITQKQVNKADTFPDVLKAAEKWMESQSLGKDRSFVVVTDGPWDMSRFLYGQCVLSDLSFPRWGRQWVNVRKSYSNFYQCRRTKITNMLENLGMTFEGNLHSGRDDARNISQICIRMIEDGCILRPNEELKLSLPGEPRAFSSEVMALSDRDEESVDNKTDRSMRKSASEGIVPAFKSLNINSASEADDQENIDDLMQYYKLQKT